MSSFKKFDCIADPMVSFIEVEIIANALKDHKSYNAEILQTVLRYNKSLMNNKNWLISNILPNIETIRKDDLKNFKNEFIVGFIKNCTNLKKLELPDHFNSLIEIPNLVTHLTFGWKYN